MYTRILTTPMHVLQLRADVPNSSASHILDYHCDLVVEESGALAALLDVQWLTIKAARAARRAYHAEATAFLEANRGTADVILMTGSLVPLPTALAPCAGCGKVSGHGMAWHVCVFVSTFLRCFLYRLASRLVPSSSAWGARLRTTATPHANRRRGARTERNARMPASRVRHND